MYILSELISICSCTSVTCFELDPGYFHTGLKVPEKQSDGSRFNTKIFQMFFALKHISEGKYYIFICIFKILFQSNFLEENENTSFLCSRSFFFPLELFILPVKRDVNSVLLIEIWFLNSYWCWIILEQFSKHLLYAKYLTCFQSRLTLLTWKGKKIVTRIRYTIHLFMHMCALRFSKLKFLK